MGNPFHVEMVVLTRRDGRTRPLEYNLNDGLISPAESNTRLILMFLVLGLVCNLTLTVLIGYYYEMTEESKPTDL